MKQLRSTLVVLPLALLGLAWVSSGYSFLRLDAPTQADSLAYPDYIARQMRFKNKYSWLRYDQNYLEFPHAGALSRFLAALRTANRRQVKIVHMGDSHIQADIFTGHIRNRMQDVFGEAGRGTLFPMNTVRTHDAYDYQSYAFGSWVGTRNIVLVPTLDLGMHGASSKTVYPGSGFRIVFNRFYRKTEERELRIYCKKGPQSFQLQLRYNLSDPAMDIVVDNDTTVPYVRVVLPEAPGMLELKTVKTGEDQCEFELHGLMLYRPENKGVLYCSMGINGAGLGSALRQNLMPAQLEELNPDLVILDLSGNEYYIGGLNRVEFGARLRMLIDKVREASPTSSILVSCSQDIYRGYYNISATGPAAELAREIAFEKGCAFYNYHRVAGGQYSMLKWRQMYLANYDRVHLSYEGYNAKGELYTHALLNTYYLYLQGETNSPHTLDSTQLAMLPEPIFTGRSIEVPTLPSQTAALGATASAPAGTKQVHVVRQGETLGHIASRYGVRVSSLQAWNGLNGTMIRAGQKLLIFSDRKPLPVPVAAPPAPASPTVNPNGPATWHTIQQGETLWSLSKRYGTTVDNIQKLNPNLAQTLRPGQKVRVK